MSAEPPHPGHGAQLLKDEHVAEKQVQGGPPLPPKHSAWGAFRWTGMCGWLEAGGPPAVSPGAPAANSCSWRVSLLLTYGDLAPGPAGATRWALACHVPEMAPLDCSVSGLGQC